MKLRTVKLGEVTEVIAGQSPASEFYNKDGNGIPFFQGKADFGELHPRVRYWCSQPTKIALNGDILISVRAPVGPTNIANQKCCVGRGLSAIRVGPDISQKFLLHFFRSMEDKWGKLVRGSTFEAITNSDLRNLEIPLPPLEQQRHIAAVLDAADALRQKRRESLKKLDELLKSIFLDMFGDPVTNPRGWEVRGLEQYLTFMTSGSRGWAQYYADEGTIFLRIQNIGNNELFLEDLTFVNAPNSAEKKRTKVQAGDVLVSMTADLGRTATIPESFPFANINQHLGLLRTTGIIPEYLSAFLSSEGGQVQFKRLNREGVKAGLNFDNLKSLLILSPPMDLQNSYKIREAKVRQEIQKLESSLASLETLFASLQQQMFNS